jgi:adenosylcobinamide kinase/adenosylcobinamide-phosphate guanylyltransferase
MPPAPVHDPELPARPRLVLITGGARSGKSAFAQRLAAARGGTVLYLATAVAVDAEMAERIARHRADRPAEWTTVEAPTGAARAIGAALGDQRAVILEDLATLVANHLVGPGHAVPNDRPLELAEVEARISTELDELFAAYPSWGADLVVVTNEVGMGVVPAYPLGRAFRDLLGRANQRVAARADEVYLLVAGLPLRLK